MQRHFGHRVGSQRQRDLHPAQASVLCPPTLTCFCVFYDPHVLLNSSCAKKWVVYFGFIFSGELSVHF